MSYETNQALIKEQMKFWDEDLAMPGDEVSDQVEYLPLNSLTLPDPEVLKIYQTDPKDLKKTKSLMKAINEGQSLPPVLIDETNQVLDGYHRVLACQKLHLGTIPCIRLKRGEI